MTRLRSSMLPFAALSASYFAHIGFFNPYLPLWLKELGLSLGTISLLLSVQAATRLIAPYGWGWLSDHTGERVKLLRYGASAACIAGFGLWLPWGPLWWGLVLFIMFFHTSAMMPLSEALMAHRVSGAQGFDTKRYGRVRLWGSLGFLLTVLAAGAWFEAFGMQQFPLWTVATLLAVVASVWSLSDVKEASHGPAVSRAMAPVLRRPAVRWFLGAAFFHVLAHMSLYIFFSLYLDALGYSKTVIGLLWAISVLVEIGWFFTQSRWLPRLSLSGWLLVCAALMALRMGLTAAFAGLWWVLVLAQCLHAFTFAAHHSVNIALVSHHFSGPLRGRGQALYTVLAYGVSGVLGGLLGGALSAHWGLVSVFWASAVSSLLALLCAWQVWRLPHAPST